MPPVVAAIAVYFGVSTATVMLVAETIVMAVTIAYSAYSMATAPGAPNSSMAGIDQVTRSPIAPHRVIYGQCMVSGPLVAAFSSGNTNKYLWLVIALASHELEEIGVVYLGDLPSTDDQFNKSADPESHIVPVGGVVKLNNPIATVLSVLADTGTTDVDGGEIYTTVDPSLYTWNPNNELITFDSSLARSYVVINYKRSFVKINRHLGAPDQDADADLMANAKDAAGNLCWTSEHTLSGRAYITVRLQFSMTVFPSGIPNIKTIVKGVKDIYDPRTGITGYSNNAALCIRDYLVKRYGLNCTTNDINDASSFIPAANICDEPTPVQVGTGVGYTTDAVGYASGAKVLHLISGTGTILVGDTVTVHVVAGTYTVNGIDTVFEASSHSYVVAGSSAYTAAVGLDPNGLLTLTGDGLIAAIPPVATSVTVVPSNSEARYTCNGTFTLDQKPADIIKKILSSCAGRLVWSQGAYSLFPAAYNYPVATLTESDLRDDISITPAPSRRQRMNTVRGTFMSPVQYWQQVDFPFQQDAAAYALDNEELCQNLELTYTTSAAMAQRLANIFLQQSLHGITVTFPAKLTAFRLQPGDVVNLDIAQLGWSGKQFRVQDWTLSDNGGVDLILREESPDIYGWISAQQKAVVLPGIGLTGVPGCSEVSDLTATETAVTVPAGSVSRSNVTLTWADNDVAATGYIIQKNGVDYSTVTAPTYTFGDLLPGTYDFGVVAVTASGARSSVVSISHTVTTPSLTLPSTLDLNVIDAGDGKAKRLVVTNNEIEFVEI